MRADKNDSNTKHNLNVDMDTIQKLVTPSHLNKSLPNWRKFNSLTLHIATPVCPGDTHILNDLERTSFSLHSVCTDDDGAAVHEWRVEELQRPK